MTPRFFRGSILITEGILSYNEFMNMSVFDFERIEATFIFKHSSAKRKQKRQEKAKTKSALANLPTVKASDMGFAPEQLKGFER